MKKKGSGSKLVLNSILYSFSGLLTKCFNFFLMPLYTAYLTTEDYGITSLVHTFLTTMGFVVAFSMFSAVTRFYVDLKHDPEKLKRFYGTIVSVVFISSAFFGVLLTIFRAPLSKYVFSGVDYYPVIFVTLISLAFHCQHIIFDLILRSQQKALKSSIFSLIYFCTTALFNIIFVVVMRMGAIGSLLATLISYVWFTAYFIIEMLAKKTIKFCIDLNLLKSALKYSIPIMPHNLSTYIALLISKILIGDRVSLAGLGVYSVASQFGGLSDTIQGYVDHAYGPWLYEQLHDGKPGHKTAVRKNSKLLISVIGLFFIGISLFAHDYIILFVEKSYADAWKFVPLIVTAYTVKTMYYFYVEVLFYYKEAAKKLFWATLTSSLLNVFLSFFLVPAYGVNGSIYADILAMIVRVLIVYFFSRKYDVGLRINDFIINLFIVLAFMFGGLIPSYLWFPYEFSFVNFGYKVLVVLIYMGLVFFIHRKRLMPLLNSILTKLKNKKIKTQMEETA